jgi:hypothetical protein
LASVQPKPVGETVPPGQNGREQHEDDDEDVLENQDCQTVSTMGGIDFSSLLKDAHRHGG